MRKIYQFDGLDGGVLSIGECSAPEQLMLGITNDGHEAHMLISRDEWYALFEVRYEIKFEAKKEQADEQALHVVK